MLLNCGVGVDSWESLDCKEIQPVHPKGNQSWIFIGRTDAEAEAPILWPPDVKTWLIWKDPDAWKDWRREEKGMTPDEMFGWHHRQDGHEFEQAPGVGDGQGSLVCCSPRGHKESDTTERLNWTEPEDSSLNFIPVKMFLKLSEYNHLQLLCLFLLFPHFLTNKPKVSHWPIWIFVTKTTVHNIYIYILLEGEKILRPASQEITFMNLFSDKQPHNWNAWEFLSREERWRFRYCMKDDLITAGENTGWEWVEDPWLCHLQII